MFYVDKWGFIFPKKLRDKGARDLKQSDDVLLGVIYKKLLIVGKPALSHVEHKHILNNEIKPRQVKILTAHNLCRNSLVMTEMTKFLLKSLFQKT